MQTVPIEDLIAAPARTLWHIHIQPPALDTIRAVLVHLGPATDTASAIRRVDEGHVFLVTELMSLGLKRGIQRSTEVD